MRTGAGRIGVLVTVALFAGMWSGPGVGLADSPPAPDEQSSTLDDDSGTLPETSGLEGGDNPFGVGSGLGSDPTPEFGLSVSDLLDEDGEYTWRDGDRDIPLKLLDSLSAGEKEELDRIATAAATAYPPQSGTADNTTLNGVPARGNWFRSDTGQLYMLVGGVNVLFASHVDTAATDAVFGRHGLTSDRVSPIDDLSNGFFVSTSSDVETLELADALRTEPGVEMANPNWFTPHSTDLTYAQRNAAATSRCTKYTSWLTDRLSSCLWNLNASTDFRFRYSNLRTLTDPLIDINIGDAWKTTMGQGVTVAVVDVTWNPRHEDLRDNVDTSKSANWGGHTTENGSYHATAVAGVIGARDNTVGGRGVAPRATLVNHNYLDFQSSSTHYLSHVRNRSITAVSNHSYGVQSNGLTRETNLWYTAMRLSLAYGFGGKGTVHVHSAGNGKGNSDRPGDGWVTLSEANNHPGVVAVCAVDSFGRSTWYSEEGPGLWVCAPSRNTTAQAAILAPIGKNQYYDRFGGTSAAAPQVSGVIALMRAANANLTWRDVKLILANTAQKNRPNNSSWQTGATKYGSTSDRYSYSNKFGFGVVDAEEAVNAAKTWTLAPRQQTATSRWSGRSRTIRAGESVELSINHRSSIDFVEHITVNLGMSSNDFRNFRVTLVSPSGTESILAKEYLACKTQCGIWSSFRFGTVRHLGENPAGAWKLKLENLAPRPSSTCNTNSIFSLVSLDCTNSTGRLRYWNITVDGHKKVASTSAPSVNVTAGSDITEGGNATFTVSADPAPKSPLNVRLGISQQGVFAGSTATRTITIPTGGSTQFAVATVDDVVDEADGSVTATLLSGQGYTVGSSSSATVAVSDNDDPPVVTVTGGGGVTEGGSASFVVSASPPPVSPLSVSLSVSQSGDFAASGTVGSRSVTVPTSGSVSFSVSTVDDAVDEADGSVTVGVLGGRGYTVGSSSSASVAVADNDVSQVQEEPEPEQGSAVPDLDAPAPSEVVVRSVGGGDLLVGWPSRTDATSYRVYAYRSGGGGSRYAIHDRSRNWHLFEGLTAGRWWVRVFSYDGTFFTLLDMLNVAVSADDPPPSQKPTVTITAGNGITEGGTASFTVSASPAPSSGLTVSLSVSQSGDYAADGTVGSKTVTVPTSGSVTYTVATVDDTADEADGSVTVGVSGGQGYTVGAPSTATVAVSDNDSPPLTPVVTIVAGTGITEGGTASFTVSASPPPSSNLTVSLSVGQSGDYAASGTTGTKTVTVPTSGSVTYSVATVDDTADESDGSVTVTVTGRSGYTVGTPSTATVAVSDNDSPLPRTPVVTIVAGTGITEGGTASFTVSASPPPSSNLTVSLSVGQSGDYAASGTTGTKTVTVPTSGSATYTVSTVDDTADEADGSLTVTVTGRSGYTVGTPSTATVAVSDNDSPPPARSCATSDQTLLSQVEAKSRDPWNGGRPDLLEMFKRSYATMLGKDTYTTSDLKARPDKQGAKWQGIGPNPLWRAVYAELDRLRTCRNTSPTPTPQPQTPQVTVTGGSGITEGSAATFTVTANPAPSSNLTVSLSVSQSGNYAASGTTGTKTVSIPTSGSTSYTVTTVNDSTDEPNGSVTVSLSGGNGYTIGTPSTATVAVSDNDNPPPRTPRITITAGNGITEGATATYTISANPAPQTSLTVSLWVTQSGNYAASGTTGTKTVSIPTSGSTSYTVTTVNDSTDEPNGSVTVSLSGGNGYTIGTPSTATVAVSDNDNPPPQTPQITITAGNGITEGATATYTITANPAPTSNLTVSVTVRQTGNYATPGTTGTKTVTIPTTGTTSYTVTTVNDSIDEPNGSITVTINSRSGYTIGTPSTATVAVSDNDDPPPQTPQITITAGNGITEGAAAAYTITANPAPRTSLIVSLTVTQTGNYATSGTTGTKTVTIPTTGTTSYTVTTVNDSIDEPNGSITVTINSRSGYTIGTPSTATVAVSDNDNPPPTDKPPDLDAPPPTAAQHRTLPNGNILVGWPDKAGVTQFTIRARSGNGHPSRWVHFYQKNWYQFKGLPSGTWVIEVFGPRFTPVSGWIIVRIP